MIALALTSAALLTGAPAANGSTQPASRAATAPAGRISVGDSIMVGASGLLRRSGFTVNAKVSRQFSTAPGILRSYGTRLPRNVVVELGTNGTVSPSDCREVLRIAGPSRRVFLVNNRVARSWQVPNNRTLAECVARAGGHARVVDWYRASADAWDWFAGDWIHLTRSGSIAFSTLIDTAVDHYGR